MKFLLVDFFAVLFVGGACFAAAMLIRSKTSTTEAGKRNAALLCSSCSTVTDPATDLFIDGVWFHATCYREIHHGK